MKFNNQPIMEFKNNNELIDCLKEWQRILFLNDWTIKAELVDETDDEQSLGVTQAIYTVNAAHIMILKKVIVDKNSKLIGKVCHEHTLVHELLHLKEIPLDKKNMNILELYYTNHEHRMIEQMSKSLIMAKYNLTFDWFEHKDK